jgi:hypothetical protein
MSRSNYRNVRKTSKPCNRKTTVLTPEQEVERFNRQLHRENIAIGTQLDMLTKHENGKIL